MKTIKLTFILFCLSVSMLTTNAQIEAVSSGRVDMGAPRNNQDRDSVLNLMIFGKNGNYKAGMYLYSLIADGQEVDTKRMILTR
jgi:hypothetical protein